MGTMKTGSKDWLDDLLIEEPAYIDDAGFTSRVISQLPVTTQRPALRAAILLAMTVLACIVTAAFTPLDNYVAFFVTFTASLHAWPALVAIGTVVATIVGLCSVWMARGEVTS
jgi:type IV secretory pathway component VirB8